MKGKQRVLAIVIAVIAVVALLGSAVMGYMYGGLSPSSSSSSQASSNSDYQSLKQRVAALEEQAKAKPGDNSIQEDLANAYYDLGTLAQQNNPDEAQKDFEQAVKAYQNVLKSNKDINNLVDMATAAFYAGQNDLAEKSFKEALAENPNFLNALYNYGIFLSHAKNDYAGAIRLWQTALNNNPNAPQADRLKQLISETQNVMASSGNSPLANASSTSAASTSGNTTVSGPAWAGVEAIIYQKCIICHGPGGQVADKSFKTYDDVMRYVKPGDLNSPLLVKAKDGHVKGLTADEIGKLEDWIKNGAKEN